MGSLNYFEERDVLFRGGVDYNLICCYVKAWIHKAGFRIQLSSMQPA